MTEKAKPRKLRLALDPDRARLGFALACAGAAMFLCAAALPALGLAGAAAAALAAVCLVVEGVSLFVRRSETVLDNRSRRWRQAAGPPPFREAARGSLDQDVAAVRFVVRDAKEEEGAGGPGRAAIDFEWTSHEPSSPIVETAWPCRLRAVWRRLGRDFDLPLIEETAEGPRFVDRGEAAPLRGQPSGVMAPPPALPARSRVRLCQRGEEWSARMPSPFALRPGLFALGAVWTGLMGGAFALSLRETPAASWPLLFQGGLVALAAAGLAVMAAAVLPWISRQRVEVTREGVRAGVSVLGLWRTEKALPLEEVTAVVLGQTPGGALTAVWVDTAEDSLQLGEGLRGEDKRWLAEALRRAVGGPAAESGKRPRG